MIVIIETIILCIVFFLLCYLENGRLRLDRHSYIDVLVYIFCSCRHTFVLAFFKMWRVSGWRNDKNRMDTLSCLRQQNKGADTGRHRTEKLSPLLPEV